MTGPGKRVRVDPPILGQDEVEVTRHAQERMKQRNITEKQVFDTVRSPDVMVLDTQPNRRRYRTFLNEKKAIDVVVETINDCLVIVTTMKATLKKEERPNAS